ncbi:Uncharacterized protein GBIM_11971 [Gryllus bimaculatus]|nr:Uncharacterized protein GBIM_11971 [Gryllus bimaculatus]
MYQAALYARSNDVQHMNVSRVLREWAGRLRWSREEQEAVLDVGCGPGDVTAQLLLPRLPSSVRVLVGHDVSEEMVRHAAAAHAALAPRLRFLCTDIAARDLPATPLGACAQQLQGFHKVFSFYALQWVTDQRNVASKMWYFYSMTTLNPFLKRVPEELKTQYMEDFMRIYQRENSKFLSMEFTPEFERNNTRVRNMQIIAHVEKIKGN